ncbi:hypothetical protein J1N35_034697 [Gossypium stocksii]|uniref:Uncharacterized protein n=1 Tax=Gossypium stocksii TaxID=47602 RepID=A0A9D3ZQS8_9ROSI|nr:hypothetical protein J1N35_034697 [Gossypium stocksii]
MMIRSGTSRKQATSFGVRHQPHQIKAHEVKCRQTELSKTQKDLVYTGSKTRAVSDSITRAINASRKLNHHPQAKRGGKKIGEA